MLRTQRLLATMLPAIVAMGLGCSKHAAEKPPAVAPAAASAAKKAHVDVVAETKPRDAPAGTPIKESADGEQIDKTAADVTQYIAPFPDRVELFVAPKRQGSAAKQGGVFHEAVELLGFVNVDTPCAVLSIDGQVAPVAQGDVKYGIEVISIEPPKVVLQRGRQRWQASIEN